MTQEQLWGGLWLLLMLTLQIGAVAVMCSAWCRTTVAAFISSYLLNLLPFFCCTPGLTALDPSHLLNVATSTVFGSTITIASLMWASVFLTTRAFLPPRNYLLEFFQGLDRFFTELNTLTGDVVLIHDDQSLPATKPVAWRAGRYLHRAEAVRDKSTPKD